ncbi:MAG: RNA polymerase sigma factor [Planctomycetota bacterium]|jgi:RNA polymerase sigma factor (sigma-70 family)
MPTGEDLPDEALLARARLGDAEAFERLFRRYIGTLTSYVRRHLPPGIRRKMSIVDILQEVRIVALKGAADFQWRDGASVRNWLLKITNLTVRTKTRDFARTAKRATDREVTRGRRPATAQFQAVGASPSEMAIASELAELAEQAFRELPPDYQRILRLVREEDLALAEAGTRMGRSREAAKKLYARALSSFAAEFERLQGLGDG